MDYIAKNEKLEAYELTAENIDILTAWCSGKKVGNEITGYAIEVPGNENQCAIGDTLAFTLSKGRDFTVYDTPVFLSLCKPSPLQPKVKYVLIGVEPNGARHSLIVYTGPADMPEPKVDQETYRNLGAIRKGSNFIITKKYAYAPIELRHLVMEKQYILEPEQRTIDGVQMKGVSDLE